jgi:hypothetical protein
MGKAQKTTPRKFPGKGLTTPAGGANTRASPCSASAHQARLLFVCLDGTIQTREETMKPTERRAKMKKLKFRGIDTWGRPTYQDIVSGRFWKDVNCGVGEVALHDASDFDGEPESPINEPFQLEIDAE